jgi:hypothetical protein
MTNQIERVSSRKALEAIVWWSLALGCVLALVVAAALDPDARGYGTHAQLGLPPCGFLAFTGSPCPGCGLTTAFAHAVRGNWLRAADANVLGVILFVVVCAGIPFSITAALRGWSVDAVIERFAIGHWALAVAGCAVVLWVTRILSVI